MEGPHIVGFARYQLCKSFRSIIKHLNQNKENENIRNGQIKRNEKHAIWCLNTVEENGQTQEGGRHNILVVQLES